MRASDADSIRIPPPPARAKPPTRPADYVPAPRGTRFVFVLFMAFLAVCCCAGAAIVGAFAWWAVRWILQ